MIIYEKKLCYEAKKILLEPNAGGTSEYTEAYAMQILFENFNAKYIYTEMNIKYYNEWWKKCDFITTINNENIGVSVTRAIFTNKYNPDDLDYQISNLLYKKLSGLIIARSGVEHNIFNSSILFIWSPNRITSNIILYTFIYKTDFSLKKNIKLIIVETNFKNLVTNFKNIDNFNYIIY